MENLSSSLSEPSPRYGHISAAVRGQLCIWRTLSRAYCSYFQSDQGDMEDQETLHWVFIMALVPPWTIAFTCMAEPLDHTVRIPFTSWILDLWSGHSYPVVPWRRLGVQWFPMKVNFIFLEGMVSLPALPSLERNLWRTVGPLDGLMSYTALKVRWNARV